MKNYTVIHILLFLLMMLVYQCASAQDYILTTRGDSLTGETRPLFYGPEKRVQITTGDKKKTTFTLFEVRAFSYEGDVYHPVKGEAGYVFMKLIQPGYLTLYAFQPENQTRFDGLYLSKLDGEKMVVPNLGFKKYMGNFLADCPEIVARVKEGALTKKNLTELVTAYNACVDRRTVNHNQVVADRKEQNTKINAWDDLEAKVRALEFSERNDALEMIAEIRNKIQRKESIPNFLVEGLKNSLKNTGLTTELEQALQQVN